MEFCSGLCLRRTLYAVSVGISPIVICLLFIALARFILHCLELSYNYRQKPTDRRRRSSSIGYQSGRLTLSYTPVSIKELQRIIHGEYQTQEQSESSTITTTPSTTNTLANLVIRRNAINSTPFTALFAPISIPTFDVINEQQTRRPSLMTITHESIETTTLARLSPNHSSSVFFKS